jgi:hypothetical protein
VLGAKSVKDALAQVEYPYPGYQRELVALQKYLQMEKEEVSDPLLTCKNQSILAKRTRDWEN